MNIKNFIAVVMCSAFTLVSGGNTSAYATEGFWTFRDDQLGMRIMLPNSWGPIHTELHAFSYIDDSSFSSYLYSYGFQDVWQLFGNDALQGVGVNGSYQADGEMSYLESLVTDYKSIAELCRSVKVASYKRLSNRVFLMTLLPSFENLCMRPQSIAEPWVILGIDTKPSQVISRFLLKAPLLIDTRYSYTSFFDAEFDCIRDKQTEYQDLNEQIKENYQKMPVFLEFQKIAQSVYFVR